MSCPVSRQGEISIYAGAPMRKRAWHDGQKYLKRERKDFMTDERPARTAMYLAGHGSKTKPRLIELQYQRIPRYRGAFLHQFQKRQAFPVVFIDLHLPPYGMGKYDLSKVPAFTSLCEEVQNRHFDIIYLDLEERAPKMLTPDYETTFARSLLEDAGGTVLNAFTDDKGVLRREVVERCGENAKPFEITEVSDFVLFFPSLASDITARVLSREIQRSKPTVEPILTRIKSLKKERPYSGGGIPFVESRLSADWQKLRPTNVMNAKGTRISAPEVEKA